MPAQDRPLLGAGTVVGQRYQVVRAVAQGGMGAIYEAQDTRLGNRRCALKVLLDAGMTPQDQADVAAWFAREAQILSDLHHPLIPNISDYFSDHGHHYLVMDFVDGQTLEHLLTQRGTPGLPIEDVMGWGRELCSVLKYLHTRQPPVIFRDLKPANIMLETAGTLKLIDFGIARRLDTKRTEQTVYTMIGTPGYCPPEQYQGLADPRSDVYSLGATLHHLISGRDPRRHQPFTFPPLSTLVPAIDPAVDAAITRAVSLQAGNRFANVDEFRTALTALQTKRVAMPAGVPLQAAPAQPVLIVSSRGQGHYTTISRAIRHAQPGTRIEVQPGRYTECVVIDKPLEIVAAGPAGHVIVETIDAPCLIMRADSALVRGFTLHGRKGLAPPPARPGATAGTHSRIATALLTIAGHVRAIPAAIINAFKDVVESRPCHAVDIGHGHLVLQDCCITSDSPWCVVAIYGSAANPLIRRCVIHDGSDVGVHFYAQSQGTLEECSIIGNRTGIAVTEGSDAVIRGCTIHRGRGAGVEFYKNGHGLVEHCTIADNAHAGIEIGSAASPIIRHCRVTGNGGSAIHLRERAGGTVESCDLTQNRGGAWNTLFRFRHQMSQHGNRE
jgi:hypothetical protein